MYALALDASITTWVALIVWRQTVRKPYDYIISLGGKSFRRQFLFALNVWLEVDMESCEVIDAAIAMLHNSSLMYAALKLNQ
jgi:geranylgeranyl pyrophosphate synthase